MPQTARFNSRISGMRVNGQPVQADRVYKVARWGVGSAQSGAAPIWDVVEQYLKNGPALKKHAPNVPRLIGVDLNPGFAIDSALFHSRPHPGSAFT